MEGESAGGGLAWALAATHSRQSRTFPLSGLYLSIVQEAALLAPPVLPNSVTFANSQEPAMEGLTS